MRYPAAMKKAPKKLVLRSEALRTLNHLDLARAVGGADVSAAPCPAVIDSNRTQCTNAAPGGNGG